MKRDDDPQPKPSPLPWSDTQHARYLAEHAAYATHALFERVMERAACGCGVPVAVRGEYRRVRGNR